MSPHLRAPFYVLLASALLWTPPLRADEGESDAEVEADEATDVVVITARKWREDPESTPRSATVISGRELEAAGIATVSEAARQVANMSFTEFSARRLSFPYARGVGAGINAPAVLTYIDGVPQLGQSSTNLPLVDVQQIEFVRGPQGMLFGRNAHGGLIQITTRRPGGRDRLSASTALGNFGSQRYSLSWRGPVAADSGVYASAAFSADKRDGFSTNEVTGNDLDSRFSLYGRTQLRWVPNARTEVAFHAYGERARDGAFALFELDSLREDPRVVRNDFEGATQRDLWAPALRLRYRGDGIELSSVTAVVFWWAEEDSDTDFFALPLRTRRTAERQRQLSQELRVASSEDAGLVLLDWLSLRWQAGLLFTWSQFAVDGHDGLPTGLDRRRSRLEDLGLGLYAQTGWLLPYGFELSLGLRFDFEHKQAELSNFFEGDGGNGPLTRHDLSDDYRNLMPHSTLAWRWGEGRVSWFTAARGFKAGGFNQRTADPGLLAYRPESAWTYELGTKARFFSDRAVLSAALFWIDWDNMQLPLVDESLNGYTTNAGAARNRGFELEGRIEPIEGFQLRAGVGYTDARYRRFEDTFAGDVSGKRLAFVPEATWSVGAAYSYPVLSWLEVLARIDFSAVERFYYDPGNTQSEQYRLLGARAGVKMSHFTAELFVDNALGENYVPLALQLQETLFVGESAAPRLFGGRIRADIDFGLR